MPAVGCLGLVVRFTHGAKAVCNVKTVIRRPRIASELYSSMSLLFKFASKRASFISVFPSLLNRNVQRIVSAELSTSTGPYPNAEDTISSNYDLLKKTMDCIRQDTREAPGILPDDSASRDLQGELSAKSLRSPTIELRLSGYDHVLFLGFISLFYLSLLPLFRHRAAA